MPIAEAVDLIYIPKNTRTPQGFLAWNMKREFICNSPEEFEHLENWLNQAEGMVFGYISFEAKNLFEKNVYHNVGSDGSHLMHFVEPIHVWREENEEWHCLAGNISRSEVEAFVQSIPNEKKTIRHIQVNCEESSSTYNRKLDEIQQAIQRGDYYETNFCIPFCGQGEIENGMDHFAFLNEKTDAPHAVYFRTKNLELWCTSPERYVKRLGNKLISQPIKGTVKRGKTLEEDEQLKEELLKSKKERSENVMIVDLVRNDLSRIAKKGTVQVEELCGCYTFKNLHHLVSTVSCELEKEITFSDILQATFPMGSMTGAPKISAVQHMEKIELRSRGLYSGSFGWIDTNGDFDFNVIIRSVVVSKEKKELTFHVGSAITRASLSGNEFDECMLKAGTTLSLFEQ
ncbi:MAG: hypothetical protein RL092_1519 [Bacteroidota bacterium]|jgi:para-aminobenzoate synthetase component 1